MRSYCSLVALFCAIAAWTAPIKVLFLVGGGHHDFDYNPKILTWLLEPTGEFTFTITQDREMLTHLAGYDAVLFYTQGGSLTAAQEEGLTAFVRAGHGFVGTHCASDSFTDNDAYWKMIGGRFKSHGHEMFRVLLAPKPDAKLMKDVGDFVITDETYVNEIHKDARIQVLAKRAGDSEPVAWTQSYGKGRVFYTNLGHDKLAWGNASFQRMVTNALYWAANRTPGPTMSKVDWGFMPLFDGTNLNGWTKPSDKWTVKDGVIDCDGGGGGWLRSNEEYASFELRYEYRIAKDGNSGAFFRATVENDPAFTGHEIQILDDYGKPPDKHSTGALYDAMAPSKNPSNPAWEWNQVAITVSGRDLAIIQNGTKIITCNLDDPAMNAPLSEERKMWNRAKTGFIGFQDHGAHLQLRNIRIRLIQMAQQPSPP